MEKVIALNGNPLNPESATVYEVVCFYVRSEKLSVFLPVFYANKIVKDLIPTTSVISRMHQIIKEAEF